MTQGKGDRGRVPDLALERFRLGEMAPEEAAALERSLAVDDELQRRLRALEASDDEIRNHYPPAVLASHVRRRLEARAPATSPAPGTAPFGLRWSTVAAMAGVLALVVVVGAPLLVPRDSPSDRIKGLEPRLLLFRKTAQGSEPLQDGDTARSRDLIRVGYRAAGDRWGVIVSLDGRGVVTRHLPREGAQAAQLATGTQVLLDEAYELDDAPRWERFYLVSGSSPFDVAAVLDAARSAAAAGAAPPPTLPLHLNVRQSSVLLVKEVVP